MHTLYTQSCLSLLTQVCLGLSFIFLVRIEAAKLLNIGDDRGLNLSSLKEGTLQLPNSCPGLSGPSVPEYFFFLSRLTFLELQTTAH